MRINCLLFFCLLSLVSYGHQVSSCDWVEEIKNSNNLDNQLELIKSNYVFNNTSSCNILIKYQRDLNSEPVQLYYESDFNWIKSKDLISISITEEKSNETNALISVIVLQLNCDWLDELDNSNSIKHQLALLQNNFGKCALVIAGGYPVSSDSSSAYFGDIPLFISSIRENDIDSIHTLRGNAARTLYGTYLNSVIVVSFKTKTTIKKIHNRVVQKRKAKN